MRTSQATGSSVCSIAACGVFAQRQIWPLVLQPTCAEAAPALSHERALTPLLLLGAVGNWRARRQEGPTLLLAGCC